MNPGLGSYQFPRPGGITVARLRLKRRDTPIVNKKKAISIIHNSHLSNNGRIYIGPATDVAPAQNSLNLEE
jgi:hypothetical protein